MAVFISVFGGGVGALVAGGLVVVPAGAFVRVGGVLVLDAGDPGLAEASALGIVRTGAFFW